MDISPYFAAIGMNFVFSSKVIVLSHYFNKKHALITSLAMSGNGVGLFFLVSLRYRISMFNNCNTYHENYLKQKDSNKDY